MPKDKSGTRKLANRRKPGGNKPNNTSFKKSAKQQLKGYLNLQTIQERLALCMFPQSNADGVHWYGDYEKYEHLFKAEVPAVVNPYSLSGITRTVFTTVGSIIGYKEKGPNVCKTPLCISDRSEIYRIEDKVNNASYIMKSKSSFSEMRNHMCITTNQKGIGIKIVPEFICGKIFNGYPQEHTFLMEDLGGITLVDYFEQNKNTLTGIQLQIVSNILKTKVDALHALGYVHMDLKPQNCIVTIDAGGTLDIFLIDLESVNLIGAEYDFRAETPGYSQYLNTISEWVITNPFGFYSDDKYYYPNNWTGISREQKERRTKELRRMLKEHYKPIIKDQIGSFQPSLNEYSLKRIQSVLGLPPPTV
jgi:serine/threonine protein kinase